MVEKMGAREENVVYFVLFKKEKKRDIVCLMYLFTSVAVMKECSLCELFLSLKYLFQRKKINCVFDSCFDLVPQLNKSFYFLDFTKCYAFPQKN